MWLFLPGGQAFPLQVKELQYLDSELDEEQGFWLCGFGRRLIGAGGWVTSLWMLAHSHVSHPAFLLKHWAPLLGFKRSSGYRTFWKIKPQASVFVCSGGSVLLPGTQFMSCSSSSYKQCYGHAAYSRAGLRAHCSSLSFSIVTSVQKCTPASCEVPLILQETSPDTFSWKLCEKSRASLQASHKYMQQWKRLLYCTQLCHRQGCHILLLCSREAFVCWSRGEFSGRRKKLAAISCGHTTVPGMMHSGAATGRRVTAGYGPIWPKDISFSLCSQVFGLLILIIHSSRPEWWLWTHPDVSIYRCAWNSSVTGDKTKTGCCTKALYSFHCYLFSGMLLIAGYISDLR